MSESRLSSLKLISWDQTHYSRTSLIRTRKGQSEVPILERCPYKRGHYNDVTFMTALKLSFKTRLTLVFKLHLSLLIHSTKTLSFNSIQHCTYQLRTGTVVEKSLFQNETSYCAMLHVKSWNVKHNILQVQ